jgi:hypothetical protein
MVCALASAMEYSSPSEDRWLLIRLYQTVDRSSEVAFGSIRQQQKTGSPKTALRQLARPISLRVNSGGAERRDLCVDASSWKCFATEGTRISYLTALTGDDACGFSVKRTTHS